MRRVSWRDVGIAAGGLAVGVLAAERGRFVDWLLDTEWDWSGLPSEFFGAGLATLAGILISVRMTERSSIRMQERHESHVARDALERQRAWNALHLAVVRCEVVPPVASSAEIAANAAIDAAALPSAHPKMSASDVRRVAKAGVHRAVRRTALRTNLPDVQNRLGELVVEHDVAGLVIVSEIFDAVPRALGDDSLWPSLDDTDSMIEVVYTEPPHVRTANDLLSGLSMALEALERLADRHRREPAPKELDASEWQSPGSWPFSDRTGQRVPVEGALLAPILRLGDQLGALGYWSPARNE